MKCITWKPDAPAKKPLSLAQFMVSEVQRESISDSMDRLHHEKHAKLRRWQDAMQMNMIFGDDYVTVPEIPKGYEAYAKWWYDNELKAFK